jgi:predicted enzyme related to lactoylglutathione lyase
MSRVVHFEVMAEDPARAVEFYTKVFGWQVTKWDGPEDYWLITTGADAEAGINGAIAHSRGEPALVNTIDVSSVDEFAEKVVANGGKVVVPKMAIPGVGYLIYCQDTEGIDPERPGSKVKMSLFEAQSESALPMVAGRLRTA